MARAKFLPNSPQPMPDWIFCDCPHCGNTLRLDQNQADEASACPACKRLVSPAEALAFQEPSPAPAAAPSPESAGSGELESFRSRRRRPKPPTRATELSTPEKPAPTEIRVAAPAQPEPQPASYPIPPATEGDARTTANFSPGAAATQPPPIDHEKVRKVDWTEDEGVSLGRGFAEEFESEYDPYIGEFDGSEEQEFDEDGNPIPKKRRKRRFGRWFETLDWDETAPRTEKLEKPTKRLIQAGYVVLAIGFIILGVQMFKSRGRTGGDAGSLPGETKKLTLDTTGQDQQVLTKEEAERALRDALTKRPREIIATIRPTVERFLSTPKWADRLDIVRNPDRVRPLMEKYYSTRQDAPYPFLHVGMDETISYRENLMVLNVVMKDYSQKQIAIAYENGRFLIDWESFVGYGELEPAQMKDLRPTKPFLMRASVSRSLPPYFNYAFTDEANLDCYVLSFPDDSYAFGYVEKLTPPANRVLEYIGQNPSALLTLRLRYPEGAVVGDQVWIEEVLAEGWVLGEDPGTSTP